MKLKNVSTEKQELGRVLDNRNEYSVMIRRHNCTSDDKYSFYVDSGRERVGRITVMGVLTPSLGFVLNEMWIKGEFNCNDMSNSDVLLEVLYQYAELHGYDFSATTIQKTPSNAFVLKQHGFNPEENNERDLVYVMQADEGFHIAFHDETRRAEFMGSPKARYPGLVVEEFDPKRKLDEVILSAVYRLDDLDKNRKKRAEIQERFRVELE